MINLSAGATRMLKAYAQDAGNWNGTPLLGGNVDHAKADDGWLTELKKKGLVTTFTESARECGADQDCVWVCFTDEGRAFALAQFGIEIEGG